LSKAFWRGEPTSDAPNEVPAPERATACAAGTSGPDTFRINQFRVVAETGAVDLGAAAGAKNGKEQQYEQAQLKFREDFRLPVPVSSGF